MLCYTQGVHCTTDLRVGLWGGLDSVGFVGLGPKGVQFVSVAVLNRYQVPVPGLPRCTTGGTVDKDVSRLSPLICVLPVGLVPVQDHPSNRA